ncbi:MAG: hypothetical protein CMJ62_00200 [Planctomycetaceae bacterium]|nr:hypothetical protein [Planctomycetaceae bacterium]
MMRTGRPTFSFGKWRGAKRPSCVQEFRLALQRLGRKRLARGGAAYYPGDMQKLGAISIQGDDPLFTAEGYDVAGDRLRDFVL